MCKKSQRCETSDEIHCKSISYIKEILIWFRFLQDEYKLIRHSNNQYHNRVDNILNIFTSKNMMVTLDFKPIMKNSYEKFAVLCQFCIIPHCI